MVSRMREKLSTGQKKEIVELFFKDAFCADSAEVILIENILKASVDAIVKLKSDDRGTFYVGVLSVTEKESEGE